MPWPDRVTPNASVVIRFSFQELKIVDIDTALKNSVFAKIETESLNPASVDDFSWISGT